MVGSVVVDMAKQFADLHELEPGALISHQMDYLNNQIGRDAMLYLISQNTTNLNTVLTYLDNKIISGSLYIIENGQLYHHIKTHD